MTAKHGRAPIRITGTIVGAEKVVARLGVRLPEASITRMRNAVHALGFLLERKVKLEKLSGGVLRRVSGRLFRSINTRFIDTPTASTATVGTKLKYGRIWELTGSREFTIVPKTKQALFWPGAAHPFASAHHPAQAPRPFLKPALDEMRPTVRSTLELAMQGLGENLMAVDFETPTAALFTRLSNLAGIEYATRILDDWDNQAPAKQPALMLTSGPISEFSPNANLQGQVRPMWKLQLLAVLYVQVPDIHVAPSTILNPLIAAVCNALLKQEAEPASSAARFVVNAPGQYCTTLGGLCAFCRAFGTIERAEGLVGRVAVAHIPIEMVLTS